MPDVRYFVGEVSIRGFPVRFTDGGTREIHVADSRRRAGLGEAERGGAAEDLRGLRPVRPVSQGIRELPGRRSAAADYDGDERTRAGRKTAGDRRPGRGNPGTARRLLPGRSEKFL